MMDKQILQVFRLGLSALLAGSLLLPVSGFCGSRPVSPILMPFGPMAEDANTVADVGNGASRALTQVIRGRVVSALPGTHDTEGVLRILPAAPGSGQASGMDAAGGQGSGVDAVGGQASGMDTAGGQVTGMDIRVPNNASIRRSEEVEKVSGETGIAFFRHIHVGDVVAIAYSQAQGAAATGGKAVADKVDILYRG